MSESNFDRWTEMLGKDPEHGEMPKSSYHRNSRGPALLRLIAIVLKNHSDALADDWVGDTPDAEGVRMLFRDMMVKLGEAEEAISDLSSAIFRIAFDRHPLEAITALEQIVDDVNVDQVDVLGRAFDTEDGRFLKILHEIMEAEYEHQRDAALKNEDNQ